MERKRPNGLPAGDRCRTLWLAGVMISRSTSSGVRGCHRRDAVPRAAAAGGPGGGDLLRPRLGVIRGIESARCGAAVGAWAGASGGRPHPTMARIAAPRIAAGRRGAGFSGCPCPWGRACAAAPFRRFVTGSRWALCRIRPSRGLSIILEKTSRFGRIQIGHHRPRSADSAYTLRGGLPPKCFEMM
jgi:hypothetical protein